MAPVFGVAYEAALVEEGEALPVQDHRLQRALKMGGVVTGAGAGTLGLRIEANVKELVNSAVGEFGSVSRS